METPKPSFTTLGRISAIAECALGFNNIKYIFEFGARYGEDTIEFAKRYPNATIYSFECNTNTLAQCKQATSKYSNIVLTPKAVSDYDGTITFYPIDKEKTVTTWEDGNQGASSLLKASGKYELEQYVQQKSQAQCVRLDSFLDEYNIPSIDILWMDVQGAELMALKGLGKRLHDVRVIQCEVEMIEIYNGQPLFHDIKKFLVSHGFCFMGFSSKSEYSGDAIFIHKQKINSDSTALCKWILVPYIPKNGYCGKIEMKITNRYLLFLRRIKRFGKSFPVHKPNLDYNAIIEWERRIRDPLTGKDVQYKCVVKNYNTLDVVIPTTEKDVVILEHCINSVRKNLRHPIGNIYLVAPNDERIKTIAKEKECIFVDESKVINITKKDIHYIIDNTDRSGWLLQQLIKLSVDEFTQHKYILVLDSDTILARPIKYLHRGRTILNLSDEHHEPYYTAYRKLMDEEPISPKSFVAHGMLFSKELLQEMKLFISCKNQKNWITAIMDNIDYTDPSGFSEYETYGNYVLRHHPTKVKLEYWFNQSVTHMEEVNNIPCFIKTVSSHSYNREEKYNK